MIPESLSGNRLISDNTSIDIMNPFTKQPLSPGNYLAWSLTIDQFKEMDRQATEQYSLPIELMMENAGLQLARYISTLVSLHDKILIGVGLGNNGGGGLVAARRLAGWGYEVYLEIPDRSLKSLPAKQLTRAIAFGVKPESIGDPDVFVDAYFGFSQRLPLPEVYVKAIACAEQLDTIKISLDLPSGFDRESGDALFHPDVILTMAASKKELNEFILKADILVADIGIPSKLYEQVGIEPVPFNGEGYISLSTHKK